MSVNAVDQTTGNTTPLAGNTNNLVGNLSALTTNTKSDAVGAINEVKSDLTKVNSRMISMFTSYDASSQTFPVPDNSKPYEGQVMCAGRNLSNGSIYLLWYDAGAHGFRVGATVSGNAPSNGESVTIQYFA